VLLLGILGGLLYMHKSGVSMKKVVVMPVDEPTHSSPYSAEEVCSQSEGSADDGKTTTLSLPPVASGKVTAVVEGKKEAEGKSKVKETESNGCLERQHPPSNKEKEGGKSSGENKEEIEALRRLHEQQEDDALSRWRERQNEKEVQQKDEAPSPAVLVAPAAPAAPAAVPPVSPMVSEIQMVSLALARVLEGGRSIDFIPGQAQLTPSGCSLVEEVAEVVRQHPGVSLAVDGHTACQPRHPEGSVCNLQPLSTARCQRVVGLLRHRGVTADVAARGWGCLHPQVQVCPLPFSTTMCPVMCLVMCCAL
jgi:outer membrane protein OmpA-like peptidoglycan-associated protein